MQPRGASPTSTGRRIRTEGSPVNRSPTRHAVRMLAGAVIVLVAGCANTVTPGARAESAIRSGAASVPTSAFLPTTRSVAFTRVSTTQRWADGSVTVIPPRPGDVPAISVTDALATCGRGSACGSVSRLPVVLLGRATASGAGEQNPDGSLTPVMADTLVFEMIWSGLTCLPAVGTATGTVSGAPAYDDCTTVAWVDATTGAALYGITDGTA